jgi:hypothetical protein
MPTLKYKDPATGEFVPLVQPKPEPSIDPGNNAVIGTDGNIFVPEEILIQEGEPAPREGLDLWLDPDASVETSKYLTHAEADSLYDPRGSAQQRIAEHEQAADPHPQYATKAQLQNFVIVSHSAPADPPVGQIWVPL